MRFHFGAIPESPNFHPETDGWSKIREPGPVAIQFLAFPAALVILIIEGLLLSIVLPPSMNYSTSMELPLLTPFIIFLLLIPSHELLHAVFNPGWGRSRRSIIGFWVSKVLFYAHYDGEMSRNRFLLVFAGPLLGLSLLPIILIAGLRFIAGTESLILMLAFASVLNALLASGDAIGIVLLLLQVPADAVVRNQGWRTYWKKR